MPIAGRNRQPNMADESVCMHVYMTRKMSDEVKESAARNGRSNSGEVVAAIRKHLAKGEPNT